MLLSFIPISNIYAESFVNKTNNMIGGISIKESNSSTNSSTIFGNNFTIDFTDISDESCIKKIKMYVLLNNTNYVDKSFMIIICNDHKVNNDSIKSDLMMVAVTLLGFVELGSLFGVKMADYYREYNVARILIGIIIILDILLVFSLMNVILAVLGQPMLPINEVQSIQLSFVFIVFITISLALLFIVGSKVRENVEREIRKFDKKMDSP